MAQKTKRPTESKLKSAAAETATPRYELKLYVAGATAGSLRAIANIKAICEKYLKGRYDLKVVDVRERPALLRVDQIVALPTLIKKLPAPMRCMVGDLSRTERVLRGLDLLARTP